MRRNRRSVSGVMSLHPPGATGQVRGESQRSEMKEEAEEEEGWAV